MNPLPLLFSTSGRLPRRSFAAAVALVYLAGAASQLLLTLPVLAGAGLVPFVIAQTLIAWIWYAVHAKRLRDAGRPAGAALGVAALGLMAAVLFVLVLLAFADLAFAADRDGPLHGLIGVALVVGMAGAVAGVAEQGPFAVLMAALAALMATPLVIAMAVSLWAGTRPPAAAGAEVGTA